MKPADIDRVFGRGRLRMVTGDHVEVFREHAAPGERRRYTKRFLATAAGDFSEWTGREWRILARLVGHGIKPVPDVVRFDRGASDRAALVQTYDAGITVDHWATLLPVVRDKTTLRNIFEDCAHWWALARHSLIALDAIHELRLVHLDLKADNVCIPVDPADFDPGSRDQVLRPRFDDIALIDFAFSLVSGERLDSPLPIAEQADYEYQSPRLLRALEAGRAGDLGPTRQLDWRCDLFSLAAMLWRYLPELEDTTTGAWTKACHAKARALVRRLIEAHDAELPEQRPHAELIALASAPLAQPGLRQSLQHGWTLALDRGAAAAASPTPVTRIAAPIAPAAASPVAATHASVAATRASILTPVIATPLTSPLAAARAVPPVASAGAAMPHDQPAFAAFVDGGDAAPAAAATAANRRRPPATEPLANDRSAASTLSVDPSDIALRMMSRRREHERRVRRIAWTSGVATVAVSAAAAVAWLAPSWLSWRGTRDLQVALAPVSAQSPRRADSALAGAVAKQRSAPPRATVPAQPAATVDTAAPRDATAPTVEPGAPRDATAATSLVNVAPQIAIDPGATSPGRARPDGGDKATDSDAAKADPAKAGPAKAEPAKAAGTNGDASTAPAAATEASAANTASAALTAAVPAPGSLSRVAAPSRDGSRAPARAVAAVPVRPTGARPPQGARPVPAAATRLARASTIAPRAVPPGASNPSRIATTTITRPPALANPWPGDGAPIPWAVAGRTASRGVPTRADATAKRAAAPAATKIAALAPAPRRPESPSSTTAIVTPRAATSPGAPVTAETSPPAVAIASARSTSLPEQVSAAAASPAPVRAVAPPAGTDAAPIDYASRADDLMAHQVPRLAQRAERLVARVLFSASRSANVPGDEAIRAAAVSVGHDAGDSLADLPVSTREAQRLGAAARSEYARRGGTPEALALQARAFGANPLDAETAGNLAFLLLRQRPAQAEAARQLALLALTLHGPRQLESRIEDWATLAIASALSGRERDSRNAFLVALALASNLERQCKAALDVYALYGERLRAPVEAMLQSASASGRNDAGPFCDGPAQRLLSGSAR